LETEREERLREEERKEVESLGDEGEVSRSEKENEDEDGEEENDGDKGEGSAIATASTVQNVSEETNNAGEERATGEGAANNAAPWEGIPDGLMARWRARREGTNPSATNLPSANQASYQVPSPASPTPPTENEDY
jgi:hypothetical protein